MNYLFFDCEFATCKGGFHKICEFGYVLTDASFCVSDRGNFFIDPSIARNEWDTFALRKIIKKRISDFTSKPPFPDYYPKVKALFEKAGHAFGHSTAGDVQALNQECARFSLPPISFCYLDLSEFYRKVTRSKEQRSLTSILSELSLVGDDRAHDAESDAFNTYLCTRELLRRENELAFDCSPEDALKVFLLKYGISPAKSEAVPVQPHGKVRPRKKKTLG